MNTDANPKPGDQSRPASHPGPESRETRQSYWESRYREHDMPWDKGAPSPGLVDFLAAHPELPRGTVAVPGCGTGQDVRAWAQAGFTAFGFDLAPSAIRLAQEQTKAAGLAAQFALSDFLAYQPPQQFDWLFEHTLFCAIDPADRGAYVQATIRWVRSGGSFLAVHYLIPDTDGPPFGTTRSEIVERFSPHFHLVEDWVPRSYPNRNGLERIFWWRRS